MIGYISGLDEHAVECSLAHLPIGGLSVFFEKDSAFFAAEAWSRKDLLPCLLVDTDLPARCLEKLSL